MKTTSSQRLAQRFIYTALPCEAKPLVQSFGMTKAVDVHAFAVYWAEDLCLTVTGSGKSAMAAGIAYTQALYKGGSHPVMLNVGIAGHRHQPLGSLLLVDKATDVDSGKSHYPPLVFTPKCQTENLQTSAKPQLDYQTPCLYDMEATAFFETAGRFTLSELAQSLKIVSDNQDQTAEAVTAKQASELIAANCGMIKTMLEQLSEVSARLPVPEDPQVRRLQQEFRLTVSQQHRLKQLLARIRLLTGKPEVAIEPDIADAKALLQRLAQLAEGLPMVL